MLAGLQIRKSRGAIGSDDMAQIMPLREQVASITDQSLPWYYTTYVEDTSAVFSGQPKQIIGEITFRLKHNSTITINVEKQDGRFQKTLADRVFNGSGRYTYNMALNVKSWAPGVYKVKVYEGGNKRLTQKKFTLNTFEE